MQASMRRAQKADERRMSGGGWDVVTAGAAVRPFYPTLTRLHALGRCQERYFLCSAQSHCIVPYPSNHTSANPPFSLLPEKVNIAIPTIMGGAPVTPPPSSLAQAPPPQPQIITSDITLQAPLSRRGKGPGLVLVLNHYAAREAKEGCLDPPPLKKWAEEGFAVVQVCCYVLVKWA